MSEEERMNLLPTGILKQDKEAEEYCDMYEALKEVYQGKREKITPADFKKVI